MDNWLTLKELHEKGGPLPDTIRTYILRGQVVPKDKLCKVGNTWLIDKEWANEKYIKKGL